MTQTSKRIQHEANRWIIKEQLGSLSTEEARELQGWIERDPRHKGAYLRAQAVRAHIEGVAALTAGHRPAAAQPVGFVSRAVDWVQRYKRTAQVCTALAGTALFAVGAMYITNDLLRGRGYVSDIGELRQVVLNDGSSMLLSTATEVTVDLADTSRDVRLERGEALFEVAKDPDRPFLVHAGDITVRAIGTAFSVRHEGERVDVTVSEGTVEVSRGRGSPVTRVSANHRATIEAAASVKIQTIGSRETDRQLAWRTGRLEFDGQPLAEAVAEINRHNRRKVIVTDPKLARHPIVGSFRAVDSETFANIAAATLNARVVEDGDSLRIEPE